MDRIELNVAINGTGINPWHRFGLRQNPFPQIGKAEYAAGERKLASLDGDPVLTADDIRERLAGFDPAFVEGVIQRWQPGRRVRFKIVFPGGRNTAEPSGELPAGDVVAFGDVLLAAGRPAHFITDIADGRLEFQRDQEKIDAEAELDGIYVIRTSAAEEKLGAAETVGAYKELGNLERDFWSMKSEDIDLRPVYHYLESRVRAHVLLCMLATYLTWHLRQVLPPLTFTDNQKPAREDPVIPARRSAAAAAKDTAKITPDKLSIRGYQELVAHLATLTRNTVSFAGQRLEKLSAPTPEQRRVFELLGKPILLRLDAA